MFRTMLKSKIHRATVTDANVDYPGSITIDEKIMAAADILEHEKVHVLSLTSGNRLETYAIAGVAGSGQICVNGAAAKLVLKGEKIIILTYAQVDEVSAADFTSKVVLIDENNNIAAVDEKGSVFNSCQS
ncbi:MAG: aspartate 1-decarboxylase [Actinomycetota bacterium]|nr:aspartate 1-decarboxylase [Actinomycetota bacterium]